MDESRKRRFAGPTTLSVVIPALDEASNVRACIDSARAAGADEIIVVDGGSGDDTLAVARRAGALTLTAAPGRAVQMNAGAAIASGDILLFLHADTRLPADGGAAVRAALERPGAVLSSFRMRLDAAGIGYRVLERLVGLRTRLLGRPYGDQALALRRTLFESIGRYRKVPILEDVYLVRAAKRCGRLIALPETVTTSARRWQKRGLVRTTVCNQIVLLGAVLGVSPERLVALREGCRVPVSGNGSRATVTSTVWGK